MFQVVTPRLIIHINQSIFTLLPTVKNLYSDRPCQSRPHLIPATRLLFGDRNSYNFYSFFYQFQDMSNSQSERIY